MTMNYLVYEDGELMAGFMAAVVAVDFIEGWRADSEIRMDLVDSSTGEVLDTWVDGTWENGRF